MQHRFVKFKDPVNSLPLNERLVGIIPSAVYCGFDNIVSPVGLTLNLNHETTGELFTQQTGVVTNRRGAWISKQGVVIKEDEVIPVALETNGGNAFARIDYLIGRHLHDIIYPGGVAATYEVVKGPLGSYTAPDLGNPEDSVIIGSFIIPAGATLASQVEWVRTRVPSLGNKHYAFIDEDNRFTAQQQMKQSTSIVTIADNTLLVPASHKGVLGSIDNANSFLVEGYEQLDLIPDKPEGTLLTLIFTDPITLKGFVDQLDGGLIGLGNLIGYESDLRPIVINYSNDAQLEIPRDTPVQLLKVKTDVIFNAGTDPIFGDYWKVISVGDSAIQIQVLSTRLDDAETLINSLEAEVIAVSAKPYDIKEAYITDPALYFDITGLGLSSAMHAGWAMCNGQNGTPDLRGKVTAGYHPDDPDFNVVGAPIGSKAAALSIAQLPAHYFNAVVGLTNGGEVHIGTGSSIYLAAKSEAGGSNREYRLTGVTTPPNTGRTNTIGSNEPVSIMQPTASILKLMKLPTP